VKLVRDRGVTSARAARNAHGVLLLVAQDRTDRKETYRTRDAAKADAFNHVERFYNTVQSHATIGNLSPLDFEKKAGSAYQPVHRTGSRPYLGVSNTGSRSIRLNLD
jgi:putative transposase